jgi:hypothetical protein
MMVLSCDAWLIGHTGLSVCAHRPPFASRLAASGRVRILADGLVFLKVCRSSALRDELTEMLKQ